MTKYFYKPTQNKLKKVFYKAQHNLKTFDRLKKYPAVFNL